MSHSTVASNGHGQSENKDGKEPTRRDFIVLAATGLTAVGAGSLVWPFVNSMNPSADVLALSTIEVDLSHIEPGQSIKAKWRGSPVFIRRRTQKEIEEVRAVALDELKDKQSDQDRVQKGHDEWLVVRGVCTHLGCVPTANSGDYHGWLCACHGSQYDASGRIRQGPAPKNLEVPAYTFLTPTKIRIG